MGKGYSPEFCQQMHKIKEGTKKNPTVVLTNGADDICACCPHNQEGICEDLDKVSRFDQNTLHLLGLSFGDRMKWEDLEYQTVSKILSKNLRVLACPNCCWSDICQEKIET